MHLIVGLGNPGRKYAGTRHNAGFAAVERVAERLGACWVPGRGEFEWAEACLGTAPVVLGKPLTYMNRSGLAVAQLRDRAGASLTELLVICDDVHLALGRLRLRPQGSHGGNRGLQSVITALATQQFPRLRIGVGGEDLPDDLVDYVLGKFAREERPLAGRVCAAAADVAWDWVAAGIEAAMNRHNRVTVA